ncbi:T9SS type A sorting domain-containing protein [Fulvivirga sp. M361]|uniref:T9SS type A sorting domain-containing protein n=1 Tax=Fulvivirga sp. M361 TaxID=2594266 RepID=UPI0016295E48|nr:T9SS type A sorting domain-containing protein [Fulvivirga sp. M361]
MKNIILVVVFFAVFTNSFAQTTLLSENFDVGTTVPNPPSGWSNTVDFGELWSTTSGVFNSTPNCADLTIPSSSVAINSALESTNFSTSGFSSITVQWEARDDLGAEPLVLEYAIGSKSGFSSSGVTYTDNATAGSFVTQSATLPTAVNNQSVVYVRWVISTINNGASYFIDDVLIQGTASVSSTFYSIAASNTNLDDLTSWSSTQDELGANPLNFTDAGATFIIDDAGGTFDANWPAAGTIENVRVENGADLTIPSGFTLTGTVNVSDGGTLILANTTLPTIGTLGETSTVDYAQGGTQSVDVQNYGNLTISNSGTYELGNATRVRGTLNLESGILRLSIFNTHNFIVEGNVIRTSGSIRGSSSSNLTLTGTASVDNLFFTSGFENLRQLSITKSGGTVDLTSNLTIVNNLSLTQVTLDINSSTLSLSSNVSLSSSSLTSNANGTVRFVQVADGQSVPAGTYGNLQFSNFNKTLPSSGTISIAGTFTPNAATGHTITGSTILFNGTTQFIPDFTYNNLTINAGTTATAANFDIEGDFTNNGTFNAGTGLVTFSGSSTQDINGTTQFYDMQLDNNVNNEGTTTLENILTLGNAVTFDADGAADTGSFTISSTGVSSTAMVSTIPVGSSVTGNVTTERFIRAFAIDRFRNISIPLNGITGAQLDEADDVRLNSVNDGLPNVFSYSEAITGDIDQGWQAGLTSSTPMTPHTGYSVYRDVNANVTLDATGTLNQGDVDFGVTYTESSPGNPTGDGWNFLGNPYPAPIDYDLLTRNGSVGGTVSVWDAENNQYLSYNAGTATGTLTDGIIASGQGFWVQTQASSPSLTATESSKVSSTSTSFFRTKSTVEKLAITLTDTISSDVAFLVLDERATEGFDTEYDGRKLANGIFNLSTVMEGQDMVINTIPRSTSCSITTELNITNVSSGNFELVFDSFNSIGGLDRITLKDKFLDNETIINDAQNVYNFEVTDAPGSHGERFSITLEFTPAIPDIQVNNNELQISSTAESIQWFLNDEPIEGANEPTFLAEESGVYKVSLANGDCRVFSENRSFVITSLESNIGSDLHISPNPFESNVILGIDSPDVDFVSVNIYNANGILVFSKKNLDLRGNIDLSSLKSGLYIMNIDAGNEIFVRRLIKK